MKTTCTLLVAAVLLAACASEDGGAGAPGSAVESRRSTLDDTVPSESTLATETMPAAITTPTTDVSIGPLRCASDDDLEAVQTLLRSGQPTYDYQPARDLAELVGWADAVVTGSLTSAERAGGYTVLQVAGVELLAGAGEVDTIGSMSLRASGQEPDPLGGRVEFDDVTFIAFLEAFPDAPGGWAPYVEGFGFACAATSTSTASLAGLVRGTAGLSLKDIADEVRAVTAGEPGAGGFGITRPVFAGAACPALSADERTTTDGVTFFAQSSDAPVTVQVIAESETTPADPFALLLRYPPGTWRSAGGDPVDVGGTSVLLRVYPNGNGVATWDLLDGSHAYLRSRGLIEDDIVEIIDTVMPRPRDDAYPGFRIDDGRENLRFQLLHEGFDVDVSGSSAASECEAPGIDGSYRLAAVTGDPLYQYGAVIDRHVPLEVGYRDGTLLIVTGGPDIDGAPKVRDVVDADPNAWSALLTAPDQLARESMQSGQ